MSTRKKKRGKKSRHQMSRLLYYRSVYLCRANLTPGLPPLGKTFRWSSEPRGQNNLGALMRLIANDARRVCVRRGAQIGCAGASTRVFARTTPRFTGCTLYRAINHDVPALLVRSTVAPVVMITVTDDPSPPPSLHYVGATTRNVSPCKIARKRKIRRRRSESP